MPKYSRLVSKTEIVEKHDYNLNIRRYVDNTPDPEPEDVQAHLIGGVPEAEVQARQRDYAKFGVVPASLFQPERPGYLAFRPTVAAKSAIKTALEADAALQKTLAAHHSTLEDWWDVAQGDFAQLRDVKKLPDVRQELLSTIKSNLVPRPGRESALTRRTSIQASLPRSVTSLMLRRTAFIEPATANQPSLVSQFEGRNLRTSRWRGFQRII